MKIAISSTGDSLEAQIDLRFGRAKTFVVMNMSDGTYKAFENTCNLNAAQGAGIQAAEKVANLGVEALITGHCGPKAFRALSAAGIKVYCTEEGKIAEAVEKFKKGELKELASPDVEGHWA